MIRLAHLPILALGAVLGLTAADHALAQQQNSADAKKKPAKTAPAENKAKGAEKAEAKPLLVASFGDWGVYQTQAGKGRVCYTLAQPKDRAPSNLTRDPAYAFISDRPSEGVRNEVSFIMGFDVASPAPAAEAKEAKDKKKDKAKEPEAVAPTAVIGEASFDLLPKGANLWVKNAAKESELIAEMRKGAKLQIKAASKKGNVTTDTYSLAGFGQAIDRALKDCPAN